MLAERALQQGCQERLLVSLGYWGFLVLVFEVEGTQMAGMEVGSEMSGAEMLEVETLEVAMLEVATLEVKSVVRMGW